MSTSTFSIGGVGFSVHTAHEHCVDWMRHYIARVDPDTTPSFSIEYLQDIKEFKRLSEWLRSATERAPRRVFKDASFRHFGDSGGGGEIFCPDSDDPGFYVHRRSSEEFAVVSDGNVEQAVRIPLRVAREVAYRRCLARGMISLHAAAACLGSRGIVILGPSGAGKTTLLLRLLGSSAFGFISNDRALLNVEDRTLCGLPLPVRIGAGTLRAEPRLVDIAQGACELVRKRENAQNHGRGLEWGSRHKVEFSPRELVQCLGSEMHTHASLHCMIIPNMVPHKMEFGLTRIEPSDALGWIEGECTSPTDPLWPEPWVERVSAAPGVKERLRQVAHTVPVYRATYGVGDLDRAASSIGLLVRG